MKTLLNMKKALLALCCMSLMLTVPACKDRSRDNSYAKTTTTTKKTKKRGKGNRTVATTQTTKTVKSPKVKKAKRSRGVTTEVVTEQHSENVTTNHQAAATVNVD